MRRMLPFLLTLEALAVSAISLYLLVLMVIERPTNLAAALFELFFAVLMAVVLWSTVRTDKLRSAAILMNIIALPVARTLIQGDRTLLGVVVGLIAGFTLVALFLDRKALA